MGRGAHEPVDLDRLLRGIAHVYDVHQRASGGRLAPYPRGELLRVATACLEHYREADPAAVETARGLYRRYQRLADRARVDGWALETRARPWRSTPGFLLWLVGGILGLPFFLLGCLTSYVPYRVTEVVARAGARGRGSDALARLRLRVGAAAFGLYWGTLAFLLYRWSHMPALGVLALPVCAASGLFARRYAGRARIAWRRLRGLSPLPRTGLRRVGRARARLLDHVYALVERHRVETGRPLLPPRSLRWQHRVPWRAVVAGALLFLGAWFAWGLRDVAVSEIPDRPSPWATLPGERARVTAEQDAQGLVSLLDTLTALEQRMVELKTGFDLGERHFTDVADDEAIRQALLTYLTCRDGLFRMAWYYRAPDRPEEPETSEKAFLLGYVAALELYRRGMQFVETFQDAPNAIRKLNEPESTWQVPPRVYDRVRQNLANADLREEVAAAAGRFAASPEAGPWANLEPWKSIRRAAEEGEAVVRRLSERLWSYKWDAAVARARRAAEGGRYAASSFFAHLVGGVRVRGGELAEGLVSDEQVEWLRREVLQPGDILIERRNWALSNVFLPGYWTHAALYVGGLEGIRALGLEDDPRTRLARTVFAAPDAHGYPAVVVEALAPGVIASSLETSVGEADAVCVLRPRLPAPDVADAVARALSHLGKPYDFDFDFFSSDRLVCTELVWRAFDGRIELELQEVMGRQTLPAIDIVRTWARERGRDDAQLALVGFLDAREDRGEAVAGGEPELLATLDRPGLTLLQTYAGSSTAPRTLAIVLTALLALALLVLRPRTG